MTAKEKLDAALQHLPNGIDGFLRSWGLMRLAKQLTPETYWPSAAHSVIEVQQKLTESRVHLQESKEVFLETFVEMYCKQS